MINLPKLNLPTYQAKIRVIEEKNEIWDPARKKYVSLIPEEWVRQNFINYLTENLNYPLSLIKVEGSIVYNQKSKRPDVVIFSNIGKPQMIIECKATDVKISKQVFEQISIYNKVITAPYLVVTNGLIHFCCRQNFNTNDISFLDHIPTYQSLINS